MRYLAIFLALAASACTVTTTSDPCVGVVCTGGRVCSGGVCVVPSGGQPTYAGCAGGLTCAAPNTCDTVTTAMTTGGSFCSNTCTSSAACPSGPTGLAGACLMLAAASSSDPFICYPGCASNADCQTGTSCIAVTGGAVGHVCMPGGPVTGGQPVYAACDGGLTCASPNTCDTIVTPQTTGGSFCTNTCSTSASCPGAGAGLGAACLMLATAPGSPFLCYPGCGTDGDCQPGTSCIPVTGGAVGHVCMPGHAITTHPDYDHCGTSSDCTSGLCAETNVTTTTGGSLSGFQCTEPCSTSAACPDRNGMGSACLMIAGTASAFYCYQGCTFDTDCPGTGVCTPVTGGAVGHVCFPNG